MKPLDLSAAAPWRARFAADSILWATVAEGNPSRGIAVTNRTGVFQVYAWDVADDALRQLTHRERGQVIATLAADGSYIYYLDDDRGNEIGHFVRVPFAGGPPEDLIPDLPAYSGWFLRESLDGRRLGFLAADQDGFQVFVIDKAADDTLSRPRRLWHGTSLANGPYLSADGALAVIGSTEGVGKLEYFLDVVDVAGGGVVARLQQPGVSFVPVRFAPQPGDTRLLATSSASGYNRPFIWDPLTGEQRQLALDEVPGEVQAWNWDPEARRLLLCQRHAAQFRVFIYDLATDRALRLDHPNGTIGGFFGGSFAAPEEIYVTWQDATHPSRLVALDAASGALRTVLAPGAVPASIPWRSVMIPSSDDCIVQAWLATPAGRAPFPTILHTHGGPSAVQTELFSAEAQAWLDHGFAFMSVNYRGSTTFGKPFEKAIWGNLGVVEVEDMAAARNWLVDEGIARADAVLLTGGSYGGFLTLQALGRCPALWAGGMADVAIADWRLMYEDQAETLRGYQRGLFGGSPEETPEAHRTASPITYAADLKAPILVIQGRNDTRCPARQMQVYEQTLRDLGKEISVHWFDAGHGSYETDKQIEHQALRMRFAYRVLG